MRRNEDLMQTLILSTAAVIIAAFVFWPESPEHQAARIAAEERAAQVKFEQEQQEAKMIKEMLPVFLAAQNCNR